MPRERKGSMGPRVEIYDAPEMYQSQFDRLSDAERSAFHQADGVLRGAR